MAAALDGLLSAPCSLGSSRAAELSCKKANLHDHCLGC